MHCVVKIVILTCAVQYKIKDSWVGWDLTLVKIILEPTHSLPHTLWKKCMGTYGKVVMYIIVVIIVIIGM